MKRIKPQRLEEKAEIMRMLNGYSSKIIITKHGDKNTKTGLQNCSSVAQRRSTMNIDERNEKLGVFFQECQDILVKKGKDYNPNGVAFDEIYAEASALGLKPEQYLMVLTSKHWGAIKRYTTMGILESEPIRDRLKDLANYCALMAVMIDERAPTL